MKGYVVTLYEYPESVHSAERCIESGKLYDLDICMFKAVHKSISLRELELEGLTVARFNQSYSNLDAVMGNFVSQYRIWKKIVVTNEPAIVFEHDAVVVGPVPELVGDIVNLGKPSYGKFLEKKDAGIYPLFSKRPSDEYGVYIPGAHGYYVTPAGAQDLIEKAKRLGAAPCDVFINTKNFPDIKEVYPWPVEAHDTFTTIQKAAGCTAKHNYDKSYKFVG